VEGVVTDDLDGMSLPHDPYVERTTAGALLALGTVPAEFTVSAETWHDPHLSAVVAACQHLTADSRPCDPAAVRTELLRIGNRGPAVDPVWLADLYRDGCTAGSLTHHGRTLLALAARRALTLTAVRALQQARNPAVDPYEAAALLAVQTAALADSADPPRPPTSQDLETFMAGDDSYDWLVPGLFERGDRLIVTGGEGSGKSTLIRMLAVTTASGVHPFQIGRAATTPRRVLLVDLENGERHLRRALRALSQQATDTGHPVSPGMLTVESRPSGIDLTRPDDAAWLRALCDHLRPELLVIGPLYRMHARDMNLEEPARALTAVIDSIRAAHGCAIVMETHAGHGPSGQVRSLRPIGSSLFMRWPEFGYGLRDTEGDSGVMRLVEWRGPRDERDFPKHLARGGPGEWPWREYRSYRSDWQGAA